MFRNLNNQNINKIKKNTNNLSNTFIDIIFNLNINETIIFNDMINNQNNINIFKTNFIIRKWNNKIENYFWSKKLERIQDLILFFKELSTSFKFYEKNIKQFLYKPDFEILKIYLLEDYINLLEKTLSFKNRDLIFNFLNINLKKDEILVYYENLEILFSIIKFNEKWVNLFINYHNNEIYLFLNKRVKLNFTLIITNKFNQNKKLNIISLSAFVLKSYLNIINLYKFHNNKIKFYLESWINIKEIINKNIDLKYYEKENYNFKILDFFKEENKNIINNIKNNIIKINKK